MAANPLATIVEKTVLSKPVIIAIVVLIIFMFGGFDIITENPIIVIFLGLGLIVMNFIGGKKWQ